MLRQTCTHREIEDLDLLDIKFHIGSVRTLSTVSFMSCYEFFDFIFSTYYGRHCVYCFGW